jgi:hypothetical protein
MDNRSCNNFSLASRVPSDSNRAALLSKSVPVLMPNAMHLELKSDTFNSLHTQSDSKTAMTEYVAIALRLMNASEYAMSEFYLLKCAGTPFKSTGDKSKQTIQLLKCDLNSAQDDFASKHAVFVLIQSYCINSPVYLTSLRDNFSFCKDSFSCFGDVFSSVAHVLSSAAHLFGSQTYFIATTRAVVLSLP